MNDETQPSKSNTANPASLRSAEARLEALESRLTYQEDWLETLDARVREQSAEIERLTRINALMQQRLREQRSALDALDGGSESAHERPPHY
ncbi:SlyX family protein [Salinicola endophyticus]|uniref:SlyX family protein n=1 Tax=Salinicola endophyticus TaxID=1949083 RepID=A0ABY8FH62_9GAMM|nr:MULTISPECIES: SlyX family protein [Salinicola]WFF41877.1 SlyX family protein [Salinicola endophyticus]